jgi:emfourin
MQLEIVRSGGIAGVRLRATCEVPAPSEAAVRALPFGRADEPPAHPDAFQYRFTLVDADDQPSVTLNEDEIPDSLRDMVDSAMAGAELAD